MDFSQLQDRVRLELLRRIERGTLSVSLLARQTGLGQAHVSNFLRGRRGLSLKTSDKILKALHLSIEDFLPVRGGALGELMEGQIGEAVQIPLVSHAMACFERYIRASSVQTMVSFSAASVAAYRARCTSSRKQWHRFVVVRISAEDARAMDPAVEADALVLLDRHYNSLQPYRDGKANLYGVRVGSQLLLRYAEFTADRLVLRPQQLRFPVEVIEVGGGETPNDLLVGRVALVVNEK